MRSNKCDHQTVSIEWPRTVDVLKFPIYGPVINLFGLELNVKRLGKDSHTVTYKMDKKDWKTKNWRFYPHYKKIQTLLWCTYTILLFTTYDSWIVYQFPKYFVPKTRVLTHGRYHSLRPLGFCYLWNSKRRSSHFLLTKLVLIVDYQPSQGFLVDQVWPPP